VHVAAIAPQSLPNAVTSTDKFGIDIEQTRLYTHPSMCRGHLESPRGETDSVAPFSSLIENR